MIIYVLAIGNAVLMPVMTKHFYLTELTIVMIATGCKCISLALTSFATESWMLYLNCPLAIVGGLTMSCLLAVLIRLSNPQDSRKLLCLTMLCWIVIECAGTLLTTVISIELHTTLYSNVFIVLVTVMIVVFCITLWLSINLKSHNKKSLLDDVRLIENKNGGAAEGEGEQWLLDAYEDNAAITDTDVESDAPVMSLV